RTVSIWRCALRVCRQTDRSSLASHRSRYIRRARRPARGGAPRCARPQTGEGGVHGVCGAEESGERVHATEAETHQMQALVHEAMKAGAFGWSSMKTLLNAPDDGRFIPSQVASNEEYLALAQVLADFGVGSIGWTRGAAERPLPP